jgi:hypothetical protein
MSIITEVLDEYNDLIKRYDRDKTPGEIWTPAEQKQLLELMKMSDRSIEKNKASEFRKVALTMGEAVAYIASCGTGAAYFNIDEVQTELENGEVITEYDIYYNGD